MRLHHSLIEHYGGTDGIRDVRLLQSAVSQPEATFGGSYLHAFPFEMAAAYLFHIVQNHPFLDGNKRTGAASAIVFLAMNDIEIDGDEQGLVDITLRTATGNAAKDDAADFFRSHAH
ncbi:MAG TPA: type II toxin-antitoxin system death-on-curing family toxin [Planctomycetes bacterium]|nr:type II toxin-antitoxin system death-on-curing family toxin [Fuerstiella sp.]HIK92078.1 type II toxin-antitoxin system death-on-curing family toxin [Planctomycetota bacterium]